MIFSKLKNKVRRNNVNPKMSAHVIETQCELENNYKKKNWEKGKPLIIPMDDNSK